MPLTRAQTTGDGSSRGPLKTSNGSQSSLLNGSGESPFHQEPPSPTIHASRPRITMAAASALLKRIELPRGSRWINEDVRPVGSERRTWTFLTFHNFWLLINCNIATYLTGSALIPLGLTWWQAIIAIIIGNLIATVALILSSLAGAYYHIGFPIF
ncbi:hypothetical protein NW754_013525 [Fusarium falciforme]|nr:hypothetical protein NW754_013525 [Fusarium falciforme]